MRVLFVLIVLANAWAYSLGQGWIGTKPADAGRDRGSSNQELNAAYLRLGT